MLEQMLNEYLELKKQEKEIKAKKDELGTKIKEELKKLPERKYNANGYKALIINKTNFEYNDEAGIINYIKAKGLSDIYLTTEIETTKFNDELKKEGTLFENVKSFVTKNLTETLNVAKGENK